MPHRSTAALGGLLTLLFAATGSAQTVGDSATAGQVQRPATAQNGAQVYRQICQACHMPQGEGGAGAARFPALAANARLQYPAYPITMVVRGRGGMPSFADVLTPDQIAGVVGYVRTHFGNNYAEPVTAEQVRQLTKRAPGSEE
jgi:mono/diheme cytochrome c family protein